MIKQLFDKHADAVHRNAEAKGFWENGQSRNRGQMLMLMVSEAGECLETHRKMPHGKPFVNLTTEAHKYLNSPSDAEFISAFRGLVKDTVEDELADIAIRMFDFMKGWHIVWKPATNPFNVEGENFGDDLLSIVHCIVQCQALPSWCSKTLYQIEAFAEKYNIDLAKHIEWKMRYNTTRPYKHAKAY